MEYKNSTIQKIVCVLPSLLQVIWDKKLSGVKNKKYIKKKLLKQQWQQKKIKKLVWGHCSENKYKKLYLCDTNIIFYSFE